MFDVICVGSSTVDVFAKTEYSELIKVMNNKGEEDFLAYPTGAKILVKELDFTTGGGGTNVAVSLKRLGLKSAYLGCIGKDENADMIVADLKKEKVDTSLAVRKKGLSGYSIILDSIEHDRTILAYKGVNNDLKFNDIKKNKLKTKWFYFSAMMEDAFKAQERVARYAQKNKIKIAFNPSQYLAEKGSTYLKDILSKTHLIVLNKEEAQLIVGKDTVENNGYKLSKLGPSIVVITDGKNGSHCYHDGWIYASETTHMKVLETTGAGDAFASTFLAGLIRGKDIEFCLKLATTNAESVVSHYGAKNKLLKMKEALAIMKKRPVKITKSKYINH